MNTPIIKERKKRKKWTVEKIELKQHLVSSKEYDLTLEELASIIYSELIKSKSSPDYRSSSKHEGGKTNAA